MGRTEKKLLGKNADVIIEILKKAYCDEMHIFHYFWYVSINMEGIGLVTYATALKTQATGELMHAELLSNRISELGGRAPIDPAKHLTLRAALERATQFEGKAVENYNSLAKKALELGDFVTYNLATTILADEVKDEQHTEDILKSLEVK